MQKIVAQAAPDGYTVDIAGLSDVDLGNGKGALQPMELIRIYTQTGVIFYKGMVDDMDGNNRPPITPLNVPFTAKLQAFIELYNFELNKLERTIGSNSLDQGMISNQAVGAKVLDSARQIGESSINYIYNAYLNVFERTARQSSMRLWDILVFGEKGGYEGYKYALGADRVEYIKLEASDGFEKTNFDVKIEAIKDEGEKLQLEQNIQMALSKGDINLEDAIDIRELKNLKLANQLLKVKRVKKEEREEKMAMQKQAIVAQQNLQSQEMAAQTAMQKMQAELEMKMRLKQIETEYNIKTMQVEAELKSHLMAEEFQYNQQINGMEVQSLSQREREREDAKAKRISQQNTEQSKLINQRKNNLPPLNFESNEDSLDGFDLGEFEPR
jgi:hypothetical protein